MLQLLQSVSWKKSLHEGPVCSHMHIPRRGGPEWELKPRVVRSSGLSRGTGYGAGYGAGVASRASLSCTIGPVLENMADPW